MELGSTLILIPVLVSLSRCQNIIITAQGKLQGEPGEGYISYRGIPYASVDGDLGKFKQAEVAPTWDGVRESHVSRCSTQSGLDECLLMDVYVPTTGGPWPVLAWVRGGTGQYHPGRLVREGIIVVVITHRLGPFGFLCTSDKVIPGNAGLKDVLHALRWIRDNIVAFEGQPDRVVIAGQGFGAAMVEALTLSPAANGLYHGTIQQSGSALCPWAFNYDAEKRAEYFEEAIKAGDASAVLSMNTADMAAKTDKLRMPYFPFGLCVEKAFKNEERVLSEAPIDALRNNKAQRTPMIIGYNSDEAYIFVSSLKHAQAESKLLRDSTFLLPEELKFLNQREMIDVAEQITSMYFESNTSMKTLLAYHRDAYFVNHLHRSVQLRAGLQQVYYYQFSHAGDTGVEPEPGVSKTGPAHSDELAYLFPERGEHLEGDDGIVQHHLVTLWTNFVKNLNPTPDQSAPSRWDPVDPANPRLMDINTQMEMRKYPHGRASAMWDEIYDKYYYNRYNY